MRKKVAIFWMLYSLVAGFSAHAQHGRTIAGDVIAAGKEIHWMNFEQAVKLSEKEPRKILIDVYTKWCGWCKHMDATTYQDPVIIDYINSRYYAVKLDAETRDTIHFVNNAAVVTPPASRERIFVYNAQYKANEFALAILSGKMSYPTTVFMDEGYGMLSPVPGYLTTPVLESIIKYYGENSYKTVKWEDFQKQFKGETK